MPCGSACAGLRELSALLRRRCWPKLVGLLCLCAGPVGWATGARRKSGVRGVCELTRTNYFNCACVRSLGGRSRCAVCPVYALVDLLTARAALGLCPKHSLLCTASGSCVSSAALIASLRLVSGGAAATEHSMRRAGAQHYARAGVALFVIQFWVVGGLRPLSVM